MDNTPETEPRVFEHILEEWNSEDRSQEPVSEHILEQLDGHHRSPEQKRMRRSGSLWLKGLKPERKVVQVQCKPQRFDKRNRPQMPKHCTKRPTLIETVILCISPDSDNSPFDHNFLDPFRSKFWVHPRYVAEDKKQEDLWADWKKNDVQTGDWVKTQVHQTYPKGILRKTKKTVRGHAPAADRSVQPDASNGQQRAEDVEARGQSSISATDGKPASHGEKVVWDWWLPARRGNRS